ncbi:MAG: hypothetical protein IT423_12690, partial [Pirellulaceae bacterium]|nr:hypothetical protein [Pirellulaceae bacterium]
MNNPARASRDKKNRFTPDARIPLAPPARHYLLIGDITHICAVAWLLSFALFAGTPLDMLVQLLVTGLLMWALLSGAVWIILAAILTSLAIREPRATADFVEPSAIGYALLCLGLLAYACGFRNLRREIRLWLARLLEAIIDGAAIPLETEQGNHLTLPQMTSTNSLASSLPSSLPNSLTSSLSNSTGSAATSTRLISTTLSTQSAGRLTFHLMGRAFRLLILVLLATLAFAQLPINPIRRTQWWDRSLEMDGTLGPGPTVFMLAAFGLVILSIGQWRAQTRAQAGLFV